MTFGENLKKLRKEAGLTQEQLADGAGLSVITIRQYEKNRRVPNFVKMKLLAHALKIPTVDLFSDIYDTFPEGTYSLSDLYPDDASSLTTDELRKQLLINYYDMLNEEGKTVGIDVLEGLTHITKYQKEHTETIHAGKTTSL